MIRLGVNIDHVATVRQARRAHEPDPVAAAILATLGGADGITIHLREDRRHIQDRDVFRLRETVTTRLNLEMATAEDILAMAVQVKPDEATLVPEKRQELTTEGGLDLLANTATVRAAVQRLHDAGIAVALFIDPEPAQIEAAKALQADAIELQTASYSEARGAAAIAHEWEKLRAATAFALGLGLHVHMGHGLNYTNVIPIVRIPGVEELNIGHSIVSRAVLVGMERAVREMKQLLQHHAQAPHRPPTSA
ncbi:MAG: pyridoxine 5'-phosphate synthase [Gemmataceae bacterium]|nr:pyridoxine 5'-phosphate synthase [Gemmata sp.]MDW8197962.1 pyridoxine 5'-phosphate synthase [Gemmataceae bacterium]